MRKGIGIDLGGSYFRVCLPGMGIVIREPSFAAVNKESNQIVKFGSAAEAYLKEQPKNVMMTRPFRGGVMQASEVAQRLFARCRKRCIQEGDTSYRTLLSVPCALTDVEQSAMIEVAVNAGLSEPYLAYAPLAALYGSGFTVGDSVMMVTVGATKTDILALYGGYCVYMDSTDAAGDMFDEAIVSYVQRNYNVRLNMRTAETVKMRIGTVWTGTPQRSLELGGMDPYGNRKTVKISSEEMFSILEEPTALLVESVCKAITSLPLEAVKGIFDTGILLSGGGAKLEGLDKMIAGVTGVRCRRVEQPEDAVARGLEGLLAAAPSNIRSGCYNFSEFMFRK